MRRCAAVTVLPPPPLGISVAYNAVLSSRGMTNWMMYNSFVVAAVLGLDHPSARDYLLTYQTTAEQLKQSLAVIQVMVRQVLRILELPFDVMHHPQALAA